MCVLPLTAVLLSIAIQDGLRAAPGDHWPGFRGVGTSHTDAVGLPTSWGADQGVAWDIDLSGYGQSSPVVWGDRVFVTLVEGGHKEHCVVACFRLDDGYPLWRRSFEAGVAIESTGMVSKGAPTPMVDADRLYTFFESGDVFTLSHDGQLLWHRRLCQEYGKFAGNHGVSSSVVGSGDALFLLLDHEGPSYVLKLDKRTGGNRWKIDRESRVSWSTPTLHYGSTGPELIVSSNGVVEWIGLDDGDIHARMTDLRGNTIPSPTSFGDHVFIAASSGDGTFLARRSAKQPEPSVIWQADDARPSGFGTPLLAHGRVYLVNKSGSLFALSLETGEALWDQRLAESCWCSPICAGDLVYFFGKEGTTTVTRPGPEGVEVLAENTIETEGTVYGVAAVDHSFVLRLGDRLMCLRDTRPPPADTSAAEGGEPRESM